MYNQPMDRNKDSDDSHEIKESANTNNNNACRLQTDLNKEDLRPTVHFHHRKQMQGDIQGQKKAPEADFADLHHIHSQPRPKNKDFSVSLLNALQSLGRPIGSKDRYKSGGLARALDPISTERALGNLRSFDISDPLESACSFVDGKNDSKGKMPYGEMSAQVDQAGKLLKVGGCSVYFPPDCFARPQNVKISSEINPKKWPSGKRAITPCLNVEARHMKKKATVTLTTWCIRDRRENSTVDVVQYDEVSDEWEVIHSCKLDGSRTIKFQCKHFSLLQAIWHAFFPIPKIAIVPAIYISKQNFVGAFGLKQSFAVAVMLDQELAVTHCRAMVEDSLGAKVREIKMSVFKCQSDFAIESRLSCAEKGFTFSSCKPFKHNIEDAVDTAQPSVRYLTLCGDGKDTQITFRCQIFRNSEMINDDEFVHNWESEENARTRINPNSEARPEISDRASNSLFNDSSLSTKTKGNNYDDNTDNPAFTNPNQTTWHRQSMPVMRDMAPGHFESLPHLTSIIDVPNTQINIHVTGSNENYSGAAIGTVNKGTYHSVKEDCQEHVHSTLKP